MRLVADTHALVWALDASGRLSRSALDALRDPANMIYIPTLVLAELQYTFRKGRHAISLEMAEQWLESVDNASVLPVTLRMVRRAPAELDIHDSVIVGAALEIAAVEGQPVPVVTRDEMITASGSVPVIW